MSDHATEELHVSAPNGTFQSDLESLLNSYSAEAPSGTPDFLLAQFLTRVLQEFNEAVSARAAWRGESIDLPALQPKTVTLTCPDCLLLIGSDTNDNLGRLYRDHVVGSHATALRSVEDTDERLLWLLRRAGDEWGPKGVADVAARLAGQAS